MAPGAVGALVRALARVAVGPVPTGAAMIRSGCSRVATSWGPVDVFVGPLPAWGGVAVAGQPVKVAAA